MFGDRQDDNIINQCGQFIYSGTDLFDFGQSDPELVCKESLRHPWQDLHHDHSDHGADAGAMQKAARPVQYDGNHRFFADFGADRTGNNQTDRHKYFMDAQILKGYSFRERIAAR
jgi:hypothetical protein